MKSFMATIAVVVALVAAVLLYLWGTSGPSIALEPAGGAISTLRKPTIAIKAPRGPLQTVTVSARQGERHVQLLSKEFRGSGRSSRESVDLATAGLVEGDFTLETRVTGSLFGFRGRTATRSQSFTLDTTPPTVAVLTTAHNIIRGGAGLVVYTASGDIEKTGVVFAGRYVPGYRQKGDLFACLFPFPYNLEPDRFVPRVSAMDRAGNERTAGINYHIINKPFSTDRINLTPAFLEKTAEEFKNRFPGGTPLETFIKANRDLREQNVKALYEYGRKTSPTPLWEGTFLRLPNSAPLGGFAQTRIYLHNGEKVDQQDHLGFDLASTVHAPVPAANNGTVVLAGDLGIYGQCVIIDHGLGLQTLYGHLSRVAVKAGERVEKGQIIGNTGATGMAAGDHLHFGVVVAGQEVSPVEWWDPSWIRNNISDKLVSASGEVK